LPARAKTLVSEWLEKYRDELLKMWNAQNIIKLPPIE